MFQSVFPRIYKRAPVGSLPPFTRCHPLRPRLSLSFSTSAAASASWCRWPVVLYPNHSNSGVPSSHHEQQQRLFSLSTEHSPPFVASNNNNNNNNPTPDRLVSSPNEKYTRDEGWTFMNGIQALVRLPLVQRRLDQMQGLNTAGYVSGYRGSPLASYDQKLWKVQSVLNDHHVRFHASTNEELAATECWGTQQVHIGGEAKYDGVFAIWYGKGPGVDRAGDSFRHANRAGTSRLGGVLVLLGDDHSSESSTIVSASDYAMMDLMIPVLHPANVQELLDFGLHGIAMSRYAGCWVSMKTIHDTVECAASVDINIHRTVPKIPRDHPLPSDGLSIRIQDDFLTAEARMFQKMEAAKAYCRTNQLNRTIFRPSDAQLGIAIVTTGKAHMDVLQALDELGIDQTKALDLGIGLFKVGMPWPLEPVEISKFCHGAKLVIVVEEKRSLVEFQLKDLFYGQSTAPVIIGKRDEHGNPLFPAEGQLQSTQIAIALGQWIRALHTNDFASQVVARMDYLEKLWASRKQLPVTPVKRRPTFCAGCPHNTSTQVPEGSKGLAGIGCHTIALWMGDSDRRTGNKMTHMGSEGASWVGESAFSKRGHIFQNIGDGTYFHSGSLSIRNAIGAGANITFKILYNHAVAMTGGQAVDGPMTIQQLAHQLHAEGVKSIALVTTNPESYRLTEFPEGINIHPRDEIQSVQRTLREIPGVTALIYDQACATESRRKRKSGLLPKLNEKVVINSSICDGCGDCSAKSSCVAITPIQTPFGRKRQIDQSNCNLDKSCIQGFCPSFVTVQGATPRKRFDQLVEQGILTVLPEGPPPATPLLLETQPYDIVLAGIGGTGVLTVAAILGMAAHLDGKGSSVLDTTGLSQKGGSVISFVRIAPHPTHLTAPRVPLGSARLLLACDLIASQAPSVLGSIGKHQTHVLANSETQMTVDFAMDRDFEIPETLLRHRLERAAASASLVNYLPVNTIASTVFGDSIVGNMLLLGYAVQKGLIPVSIGAIEKAITLNGVNAEANGRAFKLGRFLAHDPSLLSKIVSSTQKISVEESKKPLVGQSLSRLLETFESYLTDYQDTAYAQRFRKLINRVQEIESTKVPSDRVGGLVEAVARSYFHVLANKDEYEVARLHTNGQFANELKEQFEGNSLSLRYHFSPPMLRLLLTTKDGHVRKISFGPWFGVALKAMSKLKWVRDTPLDPFRYTKDRRMAKQLVMEYEELVGQILDGLTLGNYAQAVQLAALPLDVRGYGHVREKAFTKMMAVKSTLLQKFHSSKMSQADEKKNDLPVVGAAAAVLYSTGNRVSSKRRASGSYKMVVE